MWLKAIVKDAGPQVMANISADGQHTMAVNYVEKQNLSDLTSITI